MHTPTVDKYRSGPGIPGPDLGHTPGSSTTSDTPSLTDWQAHAACRHADPTLFDDTGLPGPALEYCAVCPVTRECLTWARSEGRAAGPSGQFTGVAGGTVVAGGRPLGHRLVQPMPLPPGYDPPDTEAHYWACRYRDGDRCPSARAGHRVWRRMVDTREGAA